MVACGLSDAPVVSGALSAGGLGVACASALLAASTRAAAMAACKKGWDISGFFGPKGAEF